MNRIEVINRHLDGHGTYLEIGVNAGAAFWEVRAATKIGVDPAFIGRKLNWLAKLPKVGRVRLYPETSDVFFARPQPRQFDCVLVDGLHTAEQAYRDVGHALDHLAPGGLIVMHDCNPPTESSAVPTLAEAKTLPGYAGTGRWNGTVWRAVVRLRTRSDVRVQVLDADEGLGLVVRGEPDDVLDLTAEEVGRLTYADLAADRRRLLNLVTVVGDDLRP